ncbi:MAG: hypothetical protein OEL76_17605 [Siculibacillus sp.]|nr:hypothetical protein [Siculibacillus sp.]
MKRLTRRWAAAVAVFSTLASIGPATAKWECDAFYEECGEAGAAAFKERMAREPDEKRRTEMSLARAAKCNNDGLRCIVEGLAFPAHVGFLLSSDLGFLDKYDFSKVILLQAGKGAGPYATMFAEAARSIGEHYLDSETIARIHAPGATDLRFDFGWGEISLGKGDGGFDIELLPKIPFRSSPLAAANVESGFTFTFDPTTANVVFKTLRFGFSLEGGGLVGPDSQGEVKVGVQLDFSRDGDTLDLDGKPLWNTESYARTAALESEFVRLRRARLAAVSDPNALKSIEDRMAAIEKQLAANESSLTEAILMSATDLFGRFDIYFGYGAGGGYGLGVEKTLGVKDIGSDYVFSALTRSMEHQLDLLSEKEKHRHAYIARWAKRYGIDVTGKTLGQVQSELREKVHAEARRLGVSTEGKNFDKIVKEIDGKQNVPAGSAPGTTAPAR